MGTQIEDEIMDMIDREADGSDSLEVEFMSRDVGEKLTRKGFHDVTFYCWRYRIWSRKFPARKVE